MPAVTHRERVLTRQVVADAISAGVKQIWNVAPGADVEAARQAGLGAGLGVIEDRSCLLIKVGRRVFWFACHRIRRTFRYQKIAAREKPRGDGVVWKHGLVWLRS